MTENRKEFKNAEVEKIVRDAMLNTQQQDKNEIIELIKIEGYPIFNSVIEFLTDFGGLHVYFKNQQNGIVNDDINFDLNHAFNLEVPERVFKDYIPRVKKELCIIGTAYRDHFILLMSNDGNVYGGYDDYLCKISNTGIGAIEAIILNQSFIEIEL
ncbi:MAG TPA: SUKH-3 domain-containing protein [Pedobacter sp.]|nr:SUKH-3 domain-containing protein [Pedobacter sp.]